MRYNYTEFSGSINLNNIQKKVYLKTVDLPIGHTYKTGLGVAQPHLLSQVIQRFPKVPNILRETVSMGFSSLSLVSTKDQLTWKILGLKNVSNFCWVQSGPYKYCQRKYLGLNKSGEDEWMKT